MRNYFLIFVLCFSANLFGQDEKPITQGHILIGGDLMGQYSKTGDLKYFQTMATPNLGYFVINNLALGINIPMYYLWYKSMSEMTSYSLGVGPFLKYYANNGLLISLKTSANFEHDNSDLGITKSTTLSISPGIGYAYFINQKVSLEGGLFYEFVNSKESGFHSNHSTTNDIMLQVGFQIFL